MSGLEGLSERDRAVLRSIFDPTATIADVNDDGDTFAEEDDEPTTDAEKLSQQHRLEGIRLAASRALEPALAALSRAVQAAPTAAARSDRAQILRLMDRDDEAMEELNLALQASEGRKNRARAQALCQRGVLLRKRGSKEEARAAFLEAAKLGSGFAKKQVVELNPYAALCNQMLSEVMRGGEVKLDNIPEPGQ